MPWFVIYTKPRSEKVVAENLRNKGIKVYCPLRKVKRKWSDRYKIVEEPLFRSYCFVNLEENERSLVFDVPGFVNYLFWLKKPAIVRPEEIEIIKNLLNDFDHEAIQIQSFSIADKIRVNSGILMDQEGEVVSKQGKKIVLFIESLGMSILVDTTKTIVEKVTPF